MNRNVAGFLLSVSVLAVASLGLNAAKVAAPVLELVHMASLSYASEYCSLGLDYSIEPLDPEIKSLVGDRIFQVSARGACLLDSKIPALASPDPGVSVTQVDPVEVTPPANAQQEQCAAVARYSLKVTDADLAKAFSGNNVQSQSFNLDCDIVRAAVAGATAPHYGNWPGALTPLPIPLSP